MKKIIVYLLSALLLLGTLSGCGTQRRNPLESVETTAIFDDSGRQVTVPKEIIRIAPSGSTAQMILMTLAPELLVGLSSTPSTTQIPYFPEELRALPTFGQFYGSKANLNMEALIAAQPQIIIDLGDKKDSISQDMDMIQEQTGIPTIFLEASITQLPTTYRTLGKLLGKEEQAENLAVFIEKTLAMAEDNSAKITDKKTVLFGTGASGLDCNAEGSTQAEVLTLVGAENAIKTDVVTNRGGGTPVNLEQVYAVNPDAIILSAGGPYSELAENEWAGLTAVENGCYYEIPDLPYNWMSSPPSVNRVLGIWWLGNLLYSEIYDYDMVAVAQDFYDLFWHYSLTAEEAEAMLSRSTLRCG